MRIPPTLLNTRKRKLITRISKLPKFQFLIIARVSFTSRSLSTSRSGVCIAIVGESPAAHTAAFRGVTVVLACPETFGAVPGKVGGRDAGDKEKDGEDGTELHLGSANWSGLGQLNILNIIATRPFYRVLYRHGFFYSIPTCSFPTIMLRVSLLLV